MSIKTTSSEMTTHTNSNPLRPTILLNSPELSQSPRLSRLRDLLDTVFRDAHINGCPGKILLPDSVGRLEAGPQQLVSELGPDGFCIIMFADDTGADKIIACACAKPYKPTKAGETHGSAVNMMFKRPPVSEDESTSGHHDDAGLVPGLDRAAQSRWELLAFAVAVEFQGQGIAGKLTRMCVAEIRRRAEAAFRGKGQAGRPRIVLMLSSLQELNEAYYLKRGWTRTAIRTMPQGTGGGDSFSIVEMVKVLDDDDEK